MSYFSENDIKNYYKSSTNFNFFLKCNNLQCNDDLQHDYLLKLFWFSIFNLDKSYVFIVPSGSDWNRANKNLDKFKSKLKPYFNGKKLQHSKIKIITEDEYLQLRGYLISGMIIFSKNHNNLVEIKKHLYPRFDKINFDILREIYL